MVRDPGQMKKIYTGSDQNSFSPRVHRGHKFQLYIRVIFRTPYYVYIKMSLSSWVSVLLRRKQTQYPRAQNTFITFQSFRLVYDVIVNLTTSISIQKKCVNVI